MSEQKEIVEIQTLAPTEVQQRIGDLIANRKEIVAKVKPLLIEGVDIYTLPTMKKPSLGKPGAEKLAAVFGLRASFLIDKETMEAIGTLEGGKKYVAYICTLTHRGEFAGEGRGATFVELTRNSYQHIYSAAYSALSPEDKAKCKGPIEGKSKSTGAPYQFWKMPEAPVFDPLALNKAIKMAQKSAFVDAVIRATGMSDLFTQDVEDMEPIIMEKDEAIATAMAPAFRAEAPKTAPPAGMMDEAPFPDGPLQNEQAPVAHDVGKCPQCSSPLKQRNGKKGAFVGCSAYPKCNFTRDV